MITFFGKHLFVLLKELNASVNMLWSWSPYSPSYSLTLEKYLLPLLLTVATTAMIVFLPLYENVSIPTTMVGPSKKGIFDTDHGIPPILVFICIKILVQIDLKFLPLEIVEPKTT
jgi:hypothetical protein